MKVQSGTRSLVLCLTFRYGGTMGADIRGREHRRDDHRACLSARVTSRACKEQDLTFNASVCKVLDIHDKRSGADRLLPVWESTCAAKTSPAFPFGSLGDANVGSCTCRIPGTG